MKKHLLIIVFLTIQSTIFAQSAEIIYKNIVNNTKAFKNIEIAFDYKMINTIADINESMPGTGFLQGDAYKLNINGQEMISDGTTLWTYIAENQEVMISNANQDNNSGSPLSIIESYKDNVKVSFIENNGDLQTIEIKPNNKDEKFNSIHITFNIKTLEIKSIHVFDYNGNEFIYDLNKFITNQELPSNFFTFDENKYPEVEVIDMR